MERHTEKKPKKTTNNQFIYFVSGRKKKDSAYALLYANFAACVWKKMQAGDKGEEANIAEVIIEEV